MCWGERGFEKGPFHWKEWTDMVPSELAISFNHTGRCVKVCVRMCDVCERVRAYVSVYV